MRNTTTTVVIATGLVLAAVIVTRTPAQQSVGAGTACCLPNGGCEVIVPVDCTALGGTPNLGGAPNCSFIVCPPVPTVVSVSTEGVIINSGNSMMVFVTRAWSDGQVDVSRYTMATAPTVCDQSLNPCPPVPIVFGTCPTDINRDGDTGIQDFLTLLGGWGACGG